MFIWLVGCLIGGVWMLQNTDCHFLQFEIHVKPFQALQQGGLSKVLQTNSYLLKYPVGIMYIPSYV